MVLHYYNVCWDIRKAMETRICHHFKTDVIERCSEQCSRQGLGPGSDTQGI